MEHKCKCGEEPDRVCEHCGAFLCDDCDYGTWKDQCSLCEDCKGFKEESLAMEHTQSCLYNLNRLKVIRENQATILEYWKGDITNKPLFLKKFFSMMDNIDWEIYNVFTNSDQKRMQELCSKELDLVLSLTETALKKAKIKVSHADQA